MFKHLAVGRRVANIRLKPSSSAAISTGEPVPPNGSVDAQRQGCGRRRGGFFLKLFGATLLGIGGTATACYLNSDVKETLEMSIPYFKETEEAILSAVMSSGLLDILNDGRADVQEPPKEDFPQRIRPIVIITEDEKSRSPSVSGPSAPAAEDELTTDQKMKHSLFVKTDEKEGGKVKETDDYEMTDEGATKENVKDKNKGKDKDKKDKKDKRDKDKKKDKKDDEDKERKKLLKQEKKEEKKRRKIEKLLKEQREQEEKLKLQSELKIKALLGDISRKSLHLSGLIENAISTQVNLETKVRQHTSQLKKTLDGSESSVEDQNSAWTAVSSAHDARVRASSDAATALSAATEEMNTLRELMENLRKDPQMSSDKDYLAVQEKLIQNEYDLNVARENTRKAETEASSVLIYKELIEKGKRKFLQEFESIKHDHSVSNEDGKMSDDDWNFLITHAYKRIEQLLRRIVELELGQRVLVDSAVNFQRISDEELTQQRLKTELERQRNEFVLEKQKWDKNAREKFEIELRENLARQAAAHNDHLVHVLRVQREEQNRHFELETRERILRERESFQAAIEKWISRVKGLEIAVESRAQLERQGQLSQKLWLACQDFKDAISESEDIDGRTPLKEKLESVVLASQNDPVLKRIISEVSPVAESQGIFSVDALRHRFSHVKTVCKRVAMIDETGGTLIQFALSWLQSVLIFERSRIFTSEEDVTQFDTFTLLSNAEECIRNGDLETALDYMAQLRGMPRLVANDWINECRLTLESQLVADTIIAFAGDRSARSILKQE